MRKAISTYFTSRAYTLLEVLVAIAVLIIMMGFLFQFTIGAQRIWAASTARNTMADEANAIFNLMADDFAQMITVSADADAESTMGWWCDPQPKATTPGTLKHLCLFTMDRENTMADSTSANIGAITAVVYHYVSSSEDATNGKKLYRTSKNPAWNLIGTKKTGSESPNAVTFFADSAAAGDNTDDAYLVAENIKNLVVQADENGGGTAKPRFIKVSVTLEVPQVLQNGAKSGTGAGSNQNVTDRVFTRVFFINQ